MSGIRFAAFAALAALVLAASPPRAAGAALAITHTRFAEAYVACNNAAWPTARRQILPVDHPSMADRMRGIDSRVARGFVGENLFYGGVWGDFQPNAAATAGWALATKAFADRGDIVPRFNTRAAALAYLERWNLRGASALDARELGAIATELYLSSAEAGRYRLTPIAAGTDLSAPLSSAAARAMLAMIGSHFDVGRNVTPKSGAACPRKVLRGLFGGAKG